MSSTIVDRPFSEAARRTVNAGKTKDAAEKLGVSTGSIEEWAHGRSLPPNPVVRRAYKEVLEKILNPSYQPGERD